MGLTFFLNGFVFATWVSRTPDVRASLGLDNGQLGLLLLSVAAGAVLALPTAGSAIQRFGTISVIRGAAVPGFSLGTVAGAGLGTLSTAIEIPPAGHIPISVLVSVAIVVRSARVFPPLDDARHSRPRPRRSALAAWREPRTVLIGVMVLALALTGGSANDWLAVALVDGYDAAHWVAVAGFGALVAAMTLGRWFGPVLLDRHGGVAVLWGTMAAAGIGVLLVVYGGHPAIVIPGIVCGDWGRRSASRWE